MGLKEKILTVMQNQPTGILATIRDNKPHSCFMIFFHEDLTLYAATDKQSKKLEDIKQNPSVHVLIGREKKEWDKEFIEIEGNATVEDNAEMKQRFWNDDLRRWLNGPADPNYVLLKIMPSRIYYVNKTGAVNPEVLSL
ncbi:MAG: pyridoxamine 5'-phosphate oxidase family protein [Ectobacillus sp.]